MNLFKTLGEMYDPFQILDIPDWVKEDDVMLLSCETLHKRITLVIPITVIAEWAKFDAKLIDGEETIPFDVYYHGLMDFDRDAKMELARYCLKYHKECIEK